MRAITWNRRQMLMTAAVTGFATSAWARAAMAVSKPAITVWKDPNCGCCKDWVVHLEQHGFLVTVRDSGNTAARARLGMPAQFGSCHTAQVDGYVVEGHVPAADILRLLKERPTALGLAVPGMPVGSPGMDGPAYGGRRDPYQVLLVQANGSTSVFRAYR